IDGRNGKPGWRDLTPPALVAAFDANGKCFPPFFRPSNEGDTDPAAVSEVDFLMDLPRRLDFAELQKQQSAAHDEELRRCIKDGVGCIRDWLEHQEKRTREAHDGLLKFCAERFKDSNEEPLQIPDLGFTEALLKSFLRTAPWYV